MSLVKFFTALVNIFCGSSDSKPGGGQTQPHGQQQQHQQHHQQQQQHQQQHSTPQQPHYPPQKPQQSPSPPHRPAQGGHHYSDPNQENQHNEHYTRLRAQANEEGDKMAQCFASSHEAYERGDGAGAKQLSNEGKEHQRKMISTNKEASNWIFIENNKDSKPGEIDLHGLYVKEAIEHTDRALQEAKQRGDSELHLIVGKGLHSQGGAAKIKPAIEELMQKYLGLQVSLQFDADIPCRHQLFAELDPDNAGVLVVQMGRQGGVGPDEIARRLERDDQGCTIM